MGKRHDKIGIKQVIRLEWMDKAASMLLAEMPINEIRKNIDTYIATRKQSGGEGERGKKTYGMAIGILASWFSPDKELMNFRNDALILARQLPRDKFLPLHWALLSASYPFWFNVAKQVGKLLNLQDKITQKQIFNRLKEQYGDRETIARNARYSVRSFVAWGVLKDSEKKGCYEKGTTINVMDPQLATLIIESGLHAVHEGKGNLSTLVNDPAFFPFQLPRISGDIITQHTNRIDVVHYAAGEELLVLKNL